MSTGLVSSPVSRLDTLPADLPSLTLGWEAAKWASKYLRQPNGPRAGERFVFTTRQLRFLLHWYAVREDGSWIYHHGARRLAKGPIAHSTPVMTPDGWRKHGELRRGDRVYAADGSITAVVEIGDEVVEDCYRVTFRDGSSVVCTGSHRWPMAEFVGRRRRVNRLVSVREMVLAGVLYARPLTSGKTKATKGGVARWRSLPSPCLDGGQRDLPIDPYVFGYWLGDGDSDCPRITVDLNDKTYLLRQFDALGYEYGESFTGWQGRAYRVRFGRGWAKVALRQLSVLRNKHIPDVYLRASAEQRWALLQGIVDSDGHIGSAGDVEVCVMAGRLADDIFELAVTLGLMPTRKDVDAVIHGRVVGVRARIRFHPQPGEVVSRLPRKAGRVSGTRIHAQPFSRARTVAAIDPVAPTPARCITVAHPSHQYLVGERNVPTCNSGKSPFAAALALIEFLAPVRLKDFDPRTPGGCVGKPVSMPLVQIAAVSEEQTEHTMRMVRAFAKKGSRVVADYHLDPGLTRYNSDDGKLHVMTSSAKTAEGGEATFIVGDETEWWLGKDGAEFMNTLADNLAKSGSRMTETNNAWKPGAGGAWKPDGSGGSQAEATWDTWVRQEEDLIERGATKSGSLLLYDAVIAPPDTDMADAESLERALRFVYADCSWKTDQEIRAIMTRIWHRSSRPDDSKRKYLNWPSASEDSWCDPQAWARLANPGRELVDGERVVLFFDGSKTRDATACVGCCLSDGHVFTVGVWEPKDDVPVDAEQIDNRIQNTFERFTVVGFFSDVREWEGYAKTTWPDRWKDELDVWAVPGGKMPEPIAWDMRSHSRDFALAAELVEAEILEGSFTHDGHAAVGRHVANARRYETRWNGAISVKKETTNSADKIDACVCVIGARMVYRLALAGAGELDEPSEAYFAKRW